VRQRELETPGAAAAREFGRRSAEAQAWSPAGVALDADRVPRQRAVGAAERLERGLLGREPARQAARIGPALASLRLGIDPLDVALAVGG
jgi:hypothetical protein